MELGGKMSLKTRIDGRSLDNKEFTIHDKDGKELATIAIQSDQSATLSVTTTDGAFITKPNGWSSKK